MQDILDQIQALDLNSSNWKSQLLEILKSDNLEGIYFPLYKSISIDGNDPNRNKTLSYVAELPEGIEKNLTSEIFELVSNLIEDDEVDINRDTWLYDKALYLNNKPEDLIYIIKSAVFLDNENNLKKYGDVETAPKIINNRGQLNKATKGDDGHYIIDDKGNIDLTAEIIKDALKQWQSTSEEKGSGTKSRRDLLSGKDIIANFLKINPSQLTDEGLNKYLKSQKELVNKIEENQIDFINLKSLEDILYKEFLDTKSLNDAILNSLDKIIKKVSLSGKDIVANSLKIEKSEITFKNLLEYIKKLPAAGQLNKALNSDKGKTYLARFINSYNAKEFEGVLKEIYPNSTKGIEKFNLNLIKFTLGKMRLNEKWNY